jgi:hypothetical protein
MLVPILLTLSEPTQETADPGEHAAHVAQTGSATVLVDLTAVGLHTLAMFAVMGAAAVIVYEKLGLMILKRTWFNVDLLWAVTLVVAGVVTLFI